MLYYIIKEYFKNYEFEKKVGIDLCMKETRVINPIRFNPYFDKNTKIIICMLFF